MPRRPRVAVLGAGIMGASTALFLARRGSRVSLFDEAHAPCAGASRWNEGKIHLGFLYAGDSSLRTAERVIPGGLAFKDLVEELTGCSIDRAVTASDDIYLIHRDSVVNPAAAAHCFSKIADMLKAFPGGDRYLTDVSDCAVRPLERRELEAIADTTVINAGFRVPERSVSTHFVADRYIDALNAEPGIENLLGIRITGVRAREAASKDGPWLVEAGPEMHGPYDYVVNALWEGRPAVDQTVGIQPAASCSHRFRLCLFVRTREVVDVPSTVIATGPFGDVKNYNGRDFYLSWYPAGVMAEGSNPVPPALPEMNNELRSRVEASTWANLTELIPPVRAIEKQADKVDVNGGWVFALGRGALSNPASTLHRRDRIGVHRLGSYISIDTGKYSIAPWLARGVADSIVEA